MSLESAQKELYFCSDDKKYKIVNINLLKLLNGIDSDIIEYWFSDKKVSESSAKEESQEIYSHQYLDSITKETFLFIVSLFNFNYQTYKSLGVFFKKAKEQNHLFVNIRAYYNFAN